MKFSTGHAAEEW